MSNWKKPPLEISGKKIALLMLGCKDQQKNNVTDYDINDINDISALSRGQTTKDYTVNNKENSPNEN